MDRRTFTAVALQGLLLLPPLATRALAYDPFRQPGPATVGTGLDDPEFGDPAFGEDPFAEFDALEQRTLTRFEQRVQAAFARFDRLTREAYARAGASVAEQWSASQVRLPQATAWTGYSATGTERVQVDYANEALTFEAVAEPGETEEQVRRRLQRFGRQVLDAPPEELDRMDPVRSRVFETLHPDDSATIADPVPRPMVEPRQTTVAPLVDRPAAERELAKKPATTEPVVTDKGPRTVVSVKIPMKPGVTRLTKKAVEPAVVAQATRFGLSEPLVYAIIKNESAYNPRAVSHVPAYGLMQLVPVSGGVDAYNFVYKQKKILQPEYLFDPGQNIELGSAYLHILDTRYLRGITNPTARLWCVISGYNTGAGNVARAFVGKKSVRQAYPVINRMTPDAVYAHLRKNLPYDETRRYLKKVRASMEAYSA